MKDDLRGTERAEVRGQHPVVHSLALCYLYDTADPTQPILRLGWPRLYLPSYGRDYPGLFLRILWTQAHATVDARFSISPPTASLGLPFDARRIASHDGSAARPAGMRVAIRLRFPGPGDYVMRLELDGAVAAELPISVADSIPMNRMEQYCRRFLQRYEELALRSAVPIEKFVLLQRYPIRLSAVLSLWGGAAVVVEERDTAGNEIQVPWTQFPPHRHMEQGSNYVGGMHGEDAFGGDTVDPGRVIVKVGNDPGVWDVRGADEDARLIFEHNAHVVEQTPPKPADATFYVEGANDCAAFQAWVGQFPELVAKAVAIVPLHGDLMYHLDPSRLKMLTPRCIMFLDAERDGAGRADPLRVQFRERCQSAGLECHLTDRGRLEDYLPERLLPWKGNGTAPPPGGKMNSSQVAEVARKMTRVDLAGTEVERVLLRLAELLASRAAGGSSE